MSCLILKPNVLLLQIHKWPPENNGLCKIVLRPLCLQVTSYLGTLGDILIGPLGGCLISALERALCVWMMWVFWISIENAGAFVFFNIYLFLERGEGREKEEEKHQCVVPSPVPPTGDLAWNPGMCPDWELNLWPFGSQADTQSTEPHQPGPFFLLKAPILIPSEWFFFPLWFR